MVNPVISGKKTDFLNFSKIRKKDTLDFGYVVTYVKGVQHVPKNPVGAWGQDHFWPIL